MRLAAAAVFGIFAIICFFSIFLIPLDAPVIYVTVSTVGMILFTLAAGIFVLMEAEDEKGDEK